MLGHLASSSADTGLHAPIQRAAHAEQSSSVPGSELTSPTARQAQMTYRNISSLQAVDRVKGNKRQRRDTCNTY